MATAIDYGGREFRLGDVFGRAWAVARAAPVALFAISFLFGSLPQAVWDYFVPRLVKSLARSEMTHDFLILWSTLVYGMILGSLVQGALSLVVVAHAEGRSESLPRCLAAGLLQFMPLVGLAIISGLGIFGGMFLFLVPGLFLMAMWSVAASVLVVEGTSIFAAFRRSRFLTRGARWHVFGILVLNGAVGVAVALLLPRLGMLFDVVEFLPDGSKSLAYIVGTLIPDTLVTIFSTVLVASIYVELRHWKEGAETDNLAEIFS